MEVLIGALTWIRRIVMSDGAPGAVFDGREKPLVGFQESLTVG